MYVSLRTSVWQRLAWGDIGQCPLQQYLCQGSQIPIARSPGRQDFVRWCLMFVGSLYGTCFVSPLWRLEFRVGWYIFGQFFSPDLFLQETNEPKNKGFTQLVQYPTDVWAEIAQSVDLLRAGWSGDRIPVVARFSAPVQTGSGAHPASFTMVTGSSPGRGVDHPPNLAPSLKKEYRHTSASPLGFMACCRVNFAFTFSQRHKYFVVRVRLCMCFSHFDGVFKIELQTKKEIDAPNLLTIFSR